MTEKPKTNSTDNGMGEALAVGAVAAIVGIACLKYLAPIALGAGLGLVLYFSRYGQTLFLRIKTYLFSLAFLMLLYFGLIGFPAAHLNNDFYGVLWRVPGFWEWCMSWSRAWNDNAPGLSLLKGLRVKSLDMYDVESYVWLSLLAALVFSGIYEGFASFRKNKNTRSEWGDDVQGGARFAVASIPAHLFETMLSVVCLSWLRTGIHESLKLKFRDKAYLGSLLLTFAGVGVVGFLLGYFIAPMIPFTNLQTPFYYLTFLPVLSLVFGAFLGVSLPLPTLQNLGFESPLLDEELLDSPRAIQGVVAPGFLLGKTSAGKEFRLTEKNLGYHVEMIAPSGSGKTNTVKNLIADRIARGHGVIFLDLKGEFDVVNWMYRAAKASHREQELRLLSLTDRELSVPYNPIKYGSAHEIHSQLMNAMTWSEEYYRNISSMALMSILRGLCEYRDKTESRFTLWHVYTLLERPGSLRSFNEKLAQIGAKSLQDLALLAEKLDRSQERDKLSGLVANLNLLIFSAAGPLLTEDATRGSFDFKEAVDEGRLSYFLMNSLKLKESASILGKMILQDLMGFIGDRYARLDSSKPHKPITLIIDEFASFAVPEFIEFMDRARGAGIGIVIAHQSRADLREVSPEFQERIETNSNTTIVSGLKSSEDAEYYAGMLGTQTTEKETRQVHEGLLFERGTGVKSIREVEEYILHPNKLKQLDQGQAFAIARTVDPRWALVKIPQAQEFLESTASGSVELRTHLLSIRNKYLNSKTEKYLELEEAARAGGGQKSKILDTELAQLSNEKPDWS